MLKLTVRKEACHPEGDNVIVDIGAIDFAIECESPHVGMSDTWTVWVLDLGDVAKAASLLHALELGIAASARWIAVELMKDPVPPPSPASAATSPVLWFSQCASDTGHLTIVWELELSGKTRLPEFYVCKYAAGLIVSYPNAREKDMSRGCASEEQALAVLIEHAAPWIAVALEEELKRA